MAAPPFEPRVACDAHDVVLALALGCLAYVDRFEALVGRPGEAASEPLAGDDPALLAALVTISLGCSLKQWLTRAAAPQSSADSGGALSAPPTPSQLLR